MHRTRRSPFLPDRACARDVRAGLLPHHVLSEVFAGCEFAPKKYPRPTAFPNYSYPAQRTYSFKKRITYLNLQNGGEITNRYLENTSHSKPDIS